MANAVSGLGRFGTYKHEGHFIYLFNDAIARILKGEYSENSVLREDGAPDRFVKGFTRTVNRLYSPTNDQRDTQWIDKTPDLAQIRAVPVINKLWPSARFIFLYRPPEQAVRSSLALWRRLEGHEIATAERWTQCQRGWRAARSELGRDRYVEIYQPDMLARPGGVAGQLKPLLQLSDREVAALTRVWTNNKAVNRPRGPAGEAYDAVALAPEMLSEIRRTTRDEVAHWPALVSAATAAEEEKNDG